MYTATLKKCQRICSYASKLPQGVTLPLTKTSVTLIRRHNDTNQSILSIRITLRGTLKANSEVVLTFRWHESVDCDPGEQRNNSCVGYKFILSTISVKTEPLSLIYWSFQACETLLWQPVSTKGWWIVLWTDLQLRYSCELLLPFDLLLVRTRHEIIMVQGQWVKQWRNSTVFPPWCLLLGHHHED